MVRALLLLLFLSLAFGVAWIAVSIHRVKNYERLMSVDRFQSRVEAYVAAPKIFPELAARIGNMLDLEAGRCQYMTLPGSMGLESQPRPIEDRNFPFYANVELRDMGVLCQFNNYGEPFMVSPLQSAEIRIERRFGQVPRLTYLGGRLWASSNKFHLEWDVAGMRLQIKSQGPAIFGINQTSPLTLVLQIGKFEVEALREVNNATAMPLLVATTNDSELSSAGNLVASKGEMVTLLPSGFSEKIKQPTGAPPASTAPGEAQPSTAPPPPSTTSTSTGTVVGTMVAPAQNAAPQPQPQSQPQPQPPPTGTQTATPAPAPAPASPAPPPAPANK